ncbi:hypothetical protein WCWAEYFT_CDS0210 [Vibrio phage VB_VaC_TDDLMA]
MPKQIEVYECEHCKKQYKTLKGVLHHELNCDENPVVNRALLERGKIKQEVEDIRLKARSIPHLMQLLEEFLLTKGLKLVLRSYPSHFEYSLSNSHDSPIGYPQNWCGRRDHDGVPRGYPGWSGKWDGHIEIIDPTILNIKDTKRRDIDSLINKWSDSLMHINFLDSMSNNTGKLWLYDFPLMWEEFKNNGHELKVIETQYKELLNNHHKKFSQERLKYIINNDTSQILQELKEKTQQHLNMLDEAISSNHAYLKNKYNSENGFDFTPPYTMFEDAGYIMKRHTDLSHGEDKGNPEPSKLIQEIERLNKVASDYVHNHPEIFI